MPFIKKNNPTMDSYEHDCSRDLNELAVQLVDENPVIRRGAALNLAEHQGASEILIDRLKQDRDISVRDAILTTLISLGDTFAVIGLVECLRSEDAALRNEVVDAMKQLPEKVAPIMTSLLVDVNSDVRIFAVNILESLRHLQVETWLDRVIEDDPHINVCATAVDLLGEVGTSTSRAALIHLRSRFPDEPYICFAVNLALKRIGEDKGT